MSSGIWRYQQAPVHQIHTQATPGAERKVSAEPQQSAAVCQRTHSSVRCSCFMQHLSQPGTLNLHPLAHSPIAVRTSSHINETAQNMKAEGESSLIVASVSQLSAHCTARLTPWPAAGYVWDIIVPSFVLGHVKHLLTQWTAGCYGYQEAGFVSFVFTAILLSATRCPQTCPPSLSCPAITQSPDCPRPTPPHLLSLSLMSPAVVWPHPRIHLLTCFFPLLSLEYGSSFTWAQPHRHGSLTLLPKPSCLTTPAC